MKLIAVLSAVCIASAAAFVPSTPSTVKTALDATKGKNKEPSFFDRIAAMDLFAPVSTQNDYGARNKKGLSTQKISSGGYVPDGLSLSQYNKVRAADEKKKAANYARNVAKAGKFQDYTEFYIKRGTDTKEAWAKTVTKGHDMAKTKFDWSGKKKNDVALPLQVKKVTGKKIYRKK
jgi:hypothetical protein